MHAPGSAWLELGWRHSRASSVYTERGRRVDFVHPSVMGDALGELFDEGLFVSDELAAYAEVGIAPGLEVYGRLPLRQVRTEWTISETPEITQLNRGAGDALLGLRAGGTLGRVALSGRAHVLGPLYDNSPSTLSRGAGNSDFYDDLPPLGQGTIDVEVGAAAGVGFGVGWAQVDQALRVRNREYSTLVPGSLQVGAKPIPHLGLFTEAGWQLSLDDGRQPTFYLSEWSKSPLVIDRQHQLSVGGGAFAQPLAHLESAVKGLGLSVRYDAVVMGRRAAAVRGLSTSVFWSL